MTELRLKDGLITENMYCIQTIMWWVFILFLPLVTFVLHILYCSKVQIPEITLLIILLICCIFTLWFSMVEIWPLNKIYQKQILQKREVITSFGCIKKTYVFVIKICFWIPLALAFSMNLTRDYEVLFIPFFLSVLITAILSGIARELTTPLSNFIENSNRQDKNKPFNYFDTDTLS